MNTCLNCGGTNTSTYRHPWAKIWCNDCDFVIRDEGERNYNTLLNKEQKKCDHMNPSTIHSEIKSNFCSNCGLKLNKKEADIKWFEHFYKLNELEDCYPALDLLYKNVDYLLCNGQFDHVEYILEQFDLDKIVPEVWYGILTITLAAKDKLKNRLEIYKEIESRLIKLYPEDEPKAVERLK